MVFGMWATIERWTWPLGLLDSIYLKQPSLMLPWTLFYEFQSSRFSFFTKEMSLALAFLTLALFGLIARVQTQLQSAVPSLVRYMFPSFKGLGPILQWATRGALSPLFLQPLENETRGSNSYVRLRPHMYEVLVAFLGFWQCVGFSLFIILYGPALVDAACFGAANICYNALTAIFGPAPRAPPQRTPIHMRRRGVRIGELPLGHGLDP